MHFCRCAAVHAGWVSGWQKLGFGHAAVLAMSYVIGVPLPALVFEGSRTLAAVLAAGTRRHALPFVRCPDR